MVKGKFDSDVAKGLKEQPVPVYMCIYRKRVSFSPYKQLLVGTPFMERLKSKTMAVPGFYLDEDGFLVFIYKKGYFVKITYRYTSEMLMMIVNECRTLGIKSVVIPLATFLVEGIDIDFVLSALEQIDSKGVDIYYF